jgi:hypothetical protein
MALHRDRVWVLEQWLSLPADDLHAACTASGANPDIWWTAKDHFCHLISVENNFDKMVLAFLDGKDALDAAVPDRPRAGDDPAPMASTMGNYVDRANDVWILRHRDKAFDQLVQFSQQTRARTMELLANVPDEAFERQIPNAPWSGGSVGAMLVHPYGEHGRTHWRWVTEGLAARAS